MKFEYGTISAKRVQEINEMKIPAPGIYCGFKEFYEASERADYAHSEDEQILFFQGFTPLHDQIVLGKDDKPIYIYIYREEWFYMEFSGYEMLERKIRDGIEYKHYILEVRDNEKINQSKNKDALLKSFAKVYMTDVNGIAKVWHNGEYEAKIDIKYQGEIYK